MSDSNTRMYGFMPRRWLEKSTALAGLVNAIGRPLDRWYNLAVGIDAFFDPMSAPEEWLDFLMYAVALPAADYLSVQQKRSLISVAFEAWPLKGTNEAITKVARAICGSSAQLTNTVETAFIAGWSKAGDVVGPGVAGLTWTLQISSSVTLTDAQIRRILDPFTFALTTYTIERI